MNLSYSLTIPPQASPGSFAGLCARFPQFANPARPRAPQRPKRAGQRRRERAIAASDALCAEEFRRHATSTLRCPAASSAGLFGLRAVGDCLGDKFALGSFCWFDHATAAADRDWVQVWLSDQYYYTAQRAAGRPLSRFAMKWLRHFDGELFLLHVDGGVPLLDCRVLGVLRYIAPPLREIDEEIAKLREGL